MLLTEKIITATLPKMVQSKGACLNSICQPLLCNTIIDLMFCVQVKYSEIPVFTCRSCQICHSLLTFIKIHFLHDYHNSGVTFFHINDVFNYISGICLQF